MWRGVLGGTGVEAHLSAASVVSSILVPVAVVAIDIAGVALKLTFPFAF